MSHHKRSGATHFGRADKSARPPQWPECRARPPAGENVSARARASAGTPDGCDPWRAQPAQPNAACGVRPSDPARKEPPCRRCRDDASRRRRRRHAPRLFVAPSPVRKRIGAFFSAVQMALGRRNLSTIRSSAHERPFHRRFCYLIVITYFFPKTIGSSRICCSRTVITLSRDWSSSQ